MYGQDLSATEFLRMITMFGLNASTYKMAMGQSLLRFVRQNKTRVSREDLAAMFFDLYFARLESNKPQLLLPGRQTRMETIVNRFKVQNLTRSQAIERVEREAFNDVIGAFHVLGSQQSPVKFYEETASDLVLTDHVFEVFNGPEQHALTAEIEARWGLLEAAFQSRRDGSEFENDIRQIYLSKGYERTNITHTIDVLFAYQNGNCFYCGLPLVGEETDVNPLFTPEHLIHVDHVIPRQLVYHDDIWNLVLAHRVCNLHKSDNLVSQGFIRKLFERNEYFIASKHPISDKLIAQLGATPVERRDRIDEVYGHARHVFRSPWAGPDGYDPDTTRLFQHYVRMFNRGKTPR